MTWLAPGGGADNNVFLTIKHLAKKFDFHLVTGGEIHKNSFAQIPGLKIFVCNDLVRPISPLKDLKALFYFYKLIRREKYDIVHTHETKSSLIARVASWLAGTKFIIYGLHGVVFNDPMSKAKKKFYIYLEKWTVWMADLIVAVSKDCIIEYHKEKIAISTPYEIIYSGIDIKEFINKDYPQEKRKLLKERLGIKKDEIVLINIGRFSKAKAQILTIEAIADVMKKYLKIKCIFVGQGPELDNCKQRARELGVFENLIFYGFSDDIPSILGISDIMVITSLREGLPRVVVEASLCKVPTAGFEVEGIREVLTDGHSGFIVSQGDTMLLAKKIEQLVNNSKLRQNFGSRAFEHVRKSWDSHVMAQRLQIIYDGIKNG